MNEEWRTVIDDKGEIRENYEVSSLGRVRNVKTGKILQQQDNGNGYLQISLGRHVKGGRRMRFGVHQLVAWAFIPNDDPINKTQINHISEVRSENFVENLQWISPIDNINYGTHNEKVSKSKKGKGMGGDNPNAKEVICLENKKVFSCAKDAEKWCGKQGVDICCRGKINSCGGYHWMFLTDYNKTSEEEISNIVAIKPYISKRKVICLETKQTFNTVTEACKWCELKNAHSIRVCCKDGNKTAGGYHWQYYNDYLIEKLIAN